MTAILRRKGTRSLLLFLPLVLTVVIPFLAAMAISLLPVDPAAKPPQELLKLFLTEDAALNYRQFWLDAFTTLLCPVLFLTVPIVCGVTSASCAFVSEKENGTLETLLLSTMGWKSVFNSKITACVLLSVGVSLASFLTFTITASVSDAILSAPFFFDLEWLCTVLLVMPAAALFSVVFVALVLPRVYSTVEALQTTGYLILPFLLLYFAQFSGAFRVTALVLVIVALLLTALSVVVFNFASRGFRAERLAQPPREI